MLRVVINLLLFKINLQIIQNFPELKKYTKNLFFKNYDPPSLISSQCSWTYSMYLLRDNKNNSSHKIACFAFKVVESQSSSFKPVFDMFFSCYLFFSFWWPHKIYEFFSRFFTISQFPRYSKNSQKCTNNQTNSNTRQFSRSTFF